MDTASAYGVVVGAASTAIVGPSYRRRKIRFVNQSGVRVVVNSRPLASIADGIDVVTGTIGQEFDAGGGTGIACNGWWAWAAAAATPLTVEEVLGPP
jgi:hypothetical protein